MTPGFLHVLVPLDGSPSSELALIPAQKVAAEGGTITLVEIAEDLVASHHLPEGSDKKGFWQQQVQPVREYLAHAAKLVTREDLTVKTLVSSGHPGMAILDIIDTLDVEAVAMCSHSRSLLRRIFVGSTVQTVMPRCPVPLIIVHDPADTNDG